MIGGTDNVGSIEYIARINTSTLKADSAKADSIAKNTGDNIGKSLEVGEKRGSRAFAVLAKTAKLATAAIGIGIGVDIVKNVDNAVKRIDTLNNSARTFENMGFKAGEVKKSMDALDKSIRGLPTPLDSAVRGMTLLAASTNNVEKSQKVFSALNDAILGFGGSADMVDNAVVQLSQDLAGGRITGQTWLSLLNSGLGPALNSMARQMGITTRQLKEGLSDGSISVEKFQNSLISLDEKGGGGMKSLQQIAKDSTSGIQSSWQNMNTAIARGLANLLGAIGRNNIAGAITGIGKAAENAINFLISLGPTFTAIATSIASYLGPKLQTLWTTFQGFLPTLSTFYQTYLIPIAKILGTGLVVAIGLTVDALNVLLTVLQPVYNWLNKNKTIVWAVVSALSAYYAAMKLIALYTAFRGSIIAAANAMTLFRARTIAANAQMGIFARIMGTPFVLNVAVGGALIAIGLVLNKARQTLAVMDALNNTLDQNSASTSAATERAQAGLKAARRRGDKAAERRFLNALQNIAAAYRAKGGPVKAGSPYIVGEQGPELYVPNNSGKIIPNHELHQSSGSKIDITLNLSGIMTRSKSDERDIAKGLVKTLNDELSAKGLKLIGEGAI